MGRGGLVPYVFIGGIALLVELTSFFMLVDALGAPLVLSNLTAMALGMFTSFGLNCRYSFKVSDRLVARFMSFAAITGLSYLISTALLLLFVEILGLAAFIAKVVTLPIMLAIQFTLNRRLTFAPTKVEIDD